MYLQSSGEKRSCENDRNKAAIRNYGAAKKRKISTNTEYIHTALAPSGSDITCLWCACAGPSHLSLAMWRMAMLRRRKINRQK